MRLLVDSVFISLDRNELNVMCVGLLVLFTLQALISYFYRFQLGWIAQRVVTDLRSDMHRAVLYLPLNFFANRRTGEILSRFSSDAAAIQGIVVNAPTAIMRQLVTFLGGIGLMLWINWRLTLIVLLVIPPFVFLATFYGRRLKNLSTSRQDGLADATVALEEMLSGMRVVKSFTREQYESTRYNDYIERVFGIAVQATRQRSIFIPLITFVSLLRRRDLPVCGVSCKKRLVRRDGFLRLCGRHRSQGRRLHVRLFWICIRIVKRVWRTNCQLSMNR